MPFKRAAFCLAAVMALCSCEEEKYHVESYITEYFTLKSITISCETVPLYVLGQFDHEEDQIIIRYNATDNVGYWSTGDDRLRFNELCRMHGDIGYQPGDYTESSLLNGNRLHATCYPYIASINITSDLDFDNSHPAGTSLNDCVLIEWGSAYSFISGGHKDSSLLATSKSFLSEIEEDDFKLMTYTSARWPFTKQPTVNTDKAHTITVTYTMSDGETMSSSYKTVFCGTPAPVDFPR